MTNKLTSTALASLALLASMAAHAQSASKVYIVQLRDEPVASYQGTTSGYAATQAAPPLASPDDGDQLAGDDRPRFARARERRAARGG